MKIFINLLMVLLFLPMIGFADNEDMLPRAKMVEANVVPNAYSDPAKPIEIGADNPKFTIRLKSNPTTGYSWFIKSYNKDMVQVTKHAYIPSKSDLMGAGGFEEWHFVVSSESIIAPALSTIEFIYTRPWDLKDGRAVQFTLVTHP